MDARVKRFQQQAAQQGAGGVGKRYSAELRRLAVEVAQGRRQEPLSRIARELGISVPSLQRWIEQEEPAQFRPVQVRLAAEPERSTEPPRPILITPRGYRVEGLDASSLASLLGALG